MYICICKHVNVHLHNCNNLISLTKFHHFSGDTYISLGIAIGTPTDV